MFNSLPPPPQKKMFQWNISIQKKSTPLEMVISYCDNDMQIFIYSWKEACKVLRNILKVNISTKVQPILLYMPIANSVYQYKGYSDFWSLKCTKTSVVLMSTKQPIRTSFVLVHEKITNQNTVYNKHSVLIEQL